ncbi:TonB-dependent receptor [Sphingopyxis sp.]|uniref:TonB-dependent receptor n=1 Tax=Sphingopyxis sp. TaxID=1908224 RepID=UPI0025D1CD34|nr:TonB-dependent receptor [Sphingopyxis sp.]MBR2173815.1 TonB-dependent receptor [Sphingopyxis sp.]
MLKKAGLFTAGAIWALAAHQTAAAQEPASVVVETEESAASPDEIVVTASRREERLRDAPSAITAITGTAIETMGVQSFRDYASLVPGLSQRDSGAPGLGTVILRGMNTGGQQTTNTTAYYIDDTAFTASGFLSLGSLVTPEPELAEIERIEVLKGPQGTLYGASSLGGLIRIVTRKPDTSEFYGNVRGEISTVKGGGEGFMIRGAVNVPVVRDKLAIQAAGYYRRLPGFTDNIGTGSRNVNSSNVYGGRIALRAEPTDNLTIDLSGVLQNIENNGYSYTTVAGGTLRPLHGRYVYDHFEDFGSEVKYRLGNATVTWKTDAGSLIASGSYGNYRSDTLIDYTAVYLPIAIASAPAVLGQTVPANTGIVTNPSPRMEKYTGDVRFVSERFGPAEFMAGVFYTHENTVYDANITLRDKTSGVDLPGALATLYHTRSRSRYEEIAGYGNLTLYLSDRLDIQGGLRYAHNEQLSTTRGPNAIYAYRRLPQLEFPFSDSSTTYLAALRWRPTDNVSTYLRAASGYRPGGPQTNAAPPPGVPLVINPDTVWNYEAGIKGSFIDGALSANLAVYHIDWSGIQLNALDTSGVLIQTNGGDADIDGFEVELVARPTRNTTFTANVGHTKARIVALLPGVAAATGARAGDRLPLTPDYTVALSADQRIPLAAHATGLLGATLRFQSDMMNNYPNASPIAQPKKLPSITTLDLRTGVELERISVQLRAQNILNEFGVTNLSPDNMATVTPPRSFVLAVSAQF